MTKTYDSELRELRDEIINGDARTSAIDSAINSLRSFNDDRLAKDLLSLLSDDAEYDEGMFSLIHASEAVENPAYVNSLLASFANLAASSPRWASIVLMRALNNDATRQ